ncbi:MAG: hypothetical protein DCE90_02820 [Pseudanabaena sp.]|nr:MAG: hypothetical protein DCE90_02820 [Pseudanabaena sp.]
MSQSQAKFVQIGSGILVNLLVLASPQELKSQSLPPNIPTDPTQLPEQILEQTRPTQPQETSPEVLPPQIRPDQIDRVIEFAISTTSIRYPWLTNPTDRLTFSPTIFNPSQAESYLDTDIRFANQNPNIVKLTYGYFPKSDQFYWVLPNNRIIIETQGFQGGIVQQGRGTDLNVRSVINLSRALTGNQVVTTLPERFSEITDSINPATFSVQATVGQLVNPIGVPAAPVVINSGVDRNAPNVKVFGLAAGNNLGNLEAQNTPQVLQGFPTVNIQPLFDNGRIAFQEDSVVSEAGLAELGLSFGTGTSSNLEGFSSFPGVKILQPDKFDNFDLYQILTRRDLDRDEKAFYYLNSLFWSDLGERTPQTTTRLSQSNSTWQRLFISRPVNQSLISYDAQEVKATYNNRFVNLGASISYSFDKGRINLPQSINSTLGLLLGSTFLVFDPQNLQTQVDEAREFRDQSVANKTPRFTPLATVATPVQRQQINQRLNSTLLYSSLSSGLEQISGNLTFDSNITPSESSLWQVRTGLYRRLVQFVDRETERIQGDTIVSNLRTAVDRFGPLTFIGAQIPVDETGFLPANESFASEIVLTAPDGRQFVNVVDSSDPAFTTIPIGINRLAIAFDRIELRRRDRENGRFSNYQGSVSLPSVEAAWTGSSDNFNYSISSGLWFNVAPNTAGNVSNNNVGTREPSIGAFLNAIFVWSTSSVELGEGNTFVAINTQSPVIRLSWNSSVNPNNASFLNFSYTFARQMPDVNFSVTPGLLVIDQNDSIRTVGFLQSSLNFSGLRFRSSFELERSNLIWSVEATQSIAQSWAAGLFYKNFREVNQGFENRVNDSTYGLLLRYTIPQSSTSIETQFGFSANELDLRVRGNLRF